MQMYRRLLKFRVAAECRLGVDGRYPVYDPDVAASAFRDRRYGATASLWRRDVSRVPGFGQLAGGEGLESLGPRPRLGTAGLHGLDNAGLLHAGGYGCALSA